ncbi:glycosyltransferase family 39 protein [Candidatus Roizmanbacteria bacterium]|nr:glycosyltransferase family 39 protein [Candidatus Roizmanbacteria bacterium]
MRKRIIPYFTLILVVLISTLAFWSPFLFRQNSWFGLSIPNSNFLYIYRHYDGPLYAVVAKTLYNPQLIEKFPLDLSFDVKYFSAHLPLYPLLIRLFAPIFNYSKSTIFINVISTIILAMFFYYLVKQFKLTKHPIILTSVFLMLPRFLVVRSIGAPESLFILFILTSLFFFEKEKYLLAGLFGGLATMTKTPGILLFVAYSFVFFENKHKFKLQSLFIFLIPLGLLGVFGIYGVQYKDFSAYFHSGDNIHLVAPFAAFNGQSRWVGTAWLEDIIFYFFIYLLAVISLKDSKYRSFFYFGLVFFIVTIFIQHRDIGRYSLPLWSLACIAFERFFTSKKFLIALAILFPAIYLYAWNFSLQNMMPVSDWSHFFSR